MTWAMLCLLGWVTATTLSGYAFSVVRAVLDRIYPDTMPTSASQWLRSLLSAHDWGREVKVHRGPQNFNAFIPSSDAIILDAITHQKSDPFFWAIAAHEYGHVWLWRRLKLRPLFQNSRLVYTQGVIVARVVLITGALFGAAQLQEAVAMILSVVVACGAVVLVDEVLASVVAIWTLRQHSLSWSQTLGSAVGLLFAFLTYVSGVVADGLVLLYLDPLWSHLSGLQYWSPAETGVGILSGFVLALCTIVLFWRVLVSLICFHMKDLLLLSKDATAGHVSTAVFLLLSFAHADTPTGQVLFCVGVLGSLPVLMLPFNLILGTLFMWTVGRTLTGRQQLRDAKELQEIQGMASVLAYKDSPMARLVVTAVHTSAFPFVVWFWLS